MSFRVALVLKYLDEDYQTSIFYGVAKQAKKLGIELFCIQSDFFDVSSSQQLILLSEFSYLKLDGILFLSSILLSADADEVINNLKKVFKNIPIISIGTELKDICSVVCETENAIFQMMNHLINIHQYKKILYLGGPVDNQDNKKRESAIKSRIESEQKNDKDFSIVIRNAVLFSETHGLQLIEQYVKENPIRNVDVLIAGSDDMAIGVGKFLRSSSNESWKNCPIVGFDDIPLASTKKHSLTTIKQATFEMGQCALLAIYKLLTNQTVPLVQQVESFFVERNSCGCNNFFNEQLNYDEDLFLFREQCLRDVSYFGQEIMKIFTYDQLVQPLKDFLLNVGTNNFSLVIYDVPSISISKFGKFHLSISNNEVSEVNENVTSMEQIFKSIENNFTDKSIPRCFFHLKCNEKLLGFISYSVTHDSHVYMSLAGMFLANAINRLYELEKERNYAKELETEVKKRTMELQEESNRRRNVEATVLKISDLERKRFSLDLHDDICQRLAAMTMVCKKYADSNSEMKILFEMAQDTLQRTRQYAHNSFPVEVDYSNIIDALKNLCDSMTVENGPEIIFVSNDIQFDFNFSKEQKINVLRIAQEALQNALKHSKATKIEISIKQNLHNAIFTIQDNGIGYDENLIFNSFGSDSTFENKVIQSRRPRGLGITSMEYRANQIGGDVKIDSELNKGTKIIVTIPFDGKNGMEEL